MCQKVLHGRAKMASHENHEVQESASASPPREEMSIDDPGPHGDKKKKPSKFSSFRAGITSFDFF